MSDIFISYAPEDYYKARQLTDALSAKGWRVSSDLDIRPDLDFHADASETISLARCVIILCSKASVKSPVQMERASDAADLGKLLPVLIDQSPLPDDFPSIMPATLMNWNGGHEEEEFLVLAEAVDRVAVRFPSYFSFRKQRPLAGYLMMALGIGLFMPIPALIVTVLFLAPLPFGWSRDTVLLIVVASFVLGYLPLMSYAAYLFFVGRRQLLKPANEVLAEDPRAPVIYLRAFSDDVSSIPFTGIRYEDSIVRALRDVGPAVAVGSPGAVWPESGAARAYLEDPDWKKGVGYLLDRAAAVVVQVASTEGVYWEIEQSLRRVPRQDLLFYFPTTRHPIKWLRWLARRFPRWGTTVVPHLATQGNILRTKHRLAEIVSERDDNWKHFVAEFGELVGGKLPTKIGKGVFLYFDPDGAPHLTPMAENVAVSWIKTRGRPWAVVWSDTEELVVRGTFTSIWRIVSHEGERRVRRSLGPFIERLMKEAR